MISGFFVTRRSGIPLAPLGRGLGVDLRLRGRGKIFLCSRKPPLSPVRPSQDSPLDPLPDTTWTVNQTEAGMLNRIVVCSYSG